MKTLYSYKSNSFSHPHKTLSLHLANVLNIAEQELNDKKIENPQKKEILKLLKVVTVCHDLGKATSYFQKYLNKQDGKTLKSQHSAISALMAFYISGQIGIKYPLIPFFIIKNHHGNLKNIADSSSLNVDHSIYLSQINALDRADIENIIKEMLDFDFKYDDFFKYISVSGKIYNDIERQACAVDNNKETFFLLEFLFSLLVYADKMDAGVDSAEMLKGIKQQIKQFNTPLAVDDFIKNMPADVSKESINSLRNSIYKDAINYVDKIDLNDKIFSIHVPTGTGKTLTSLSFALKLRDRYLKQKDINPKIIYCLPFTSIIDQNYLILQQVFNNPKENLLLKHHHLSDIKYSINFENSNLEYSFDADKSGLLIESWDSSVIVTTFIQFFYSIISNQNKSLRKFHNIVNSIVILDEIQSFPYEYWNLIEESFYILSKEYGITFILVTATQPAIFPKDKIKEVIEKKEEYFKDVKLNRIEMHIDLDKDVSIDEFADKLQKDIEINEEKSFLVILNTIKSSQKIYKYLKENINMNDNDIFYLSTTIVPEHRKKIIEEIKKKGAKRKILISTQVVEAGVDIDFDFVYRDIAPLDSVFQACGRCNRNAISKDKGTVKIFSLVNEKGRKFSKFVYNAIPLDITENLLKENKIIYETKFYDLSVKYYNLLSAKRSTDSDNTILGYMEQLEFSNLNSFNIIKDRKNVYDFFIELSEEQAKDKEDFLKLLKDENIDIYEKKRKINEMKPKIYNYVVSVSLKEDEINTFKTSKYEMVGDTLYCIPADEISKFYKTADIGFNYQEEDGIF